MNVVFFTNTFTPHVGGVARSVEASSGELRRQGCRVLVVAPEFARQPDDEPEVVRVPAIQHFNGSDFSLPIPLPIQLRERLDQFAPDVLHSQHPFLLGGTALRIAAERNLPVVFTHHTLYERYTHYVPGGSAALVRSAIELGVGYANLCDVVVAPSASIAALLAARGVASPIVTVPTGVDLERFGSGDRAAGRERLGIPAAAFVVGHVGRLAAEKNLGPLTAALAGFLAGAGPTAPAAAPSSGSARTSGPPRPRSGAGVRCGLIVGEGPLGEWMRGELAAAGRDEAVVIVAGQLEGSALVDAYAAMDVFLFTSRSETQGLVLVEAMAAGVPVVAVAAPGASDVVSDGRNGRLLAEDDPAALVAALCWLEERPPDERDALRRAAWATAGAFSLPRTTAQLLAVYRSLARSPAKVAGIGVRELADSDWQRARRRLTEEWRIMRNVVHALGAGAAEDRGGAGPGEDG